MNHSARACDQVMARLEAAGYQAYQVGGCVRDRLLGKEPEDYDVTTDARPEQIQSLFPKTVATGIAHGTVTVLQDRVAVEVTTFRKETGYSDHRRPDQVIFVSHLNQDLARRDFTINAIAMDRRGNIFDPFGGRKDLTEKVIRTVGPATDRFAEDALRMVRALRFSAQLKFRLAESTLTALCQQKTLLQYLPVERITQEWEKWWKAEEPSRGLQWLWELDLFAHLPPFLNWPQPIPPPSIPLQRVDQVRDRRVRWSLLLYLCRVPSEEAKSYLAGFRLPSKEVRKIALIYQLALAERFPWTDSTAGKKKLLRMGLEPIQAALTTASKIGGWSRREEETSLAELCKWYQEMPVHSSRELAVNGRQLSKAVGRTPGPWTGRVLRSLTEAVALGEIPNRQDALIQEGCRLVQSDS
mgnify:CR=1 FL=1